MPSFLRHSRMDMPVFAGGGQPGITDGVLSAKVDL